MMIRLRRLCVFLVAAAFGLGTTAAVADSTEDLKDQGDIVQYLLPLSAWGATWLMNDSEGALQFTKAFSGAVLTTGITKGFFGRLRPDASNEFSFPSGHTTASFVAAEFIRARYRTWWASAAAYAAAGFVGYTRIQGNKHFRDDVLAGASVGMMWNWYLTSPFAETVRLTPKFDDDGFGVNFEYNFDDTGFRSSPVMDQQPRFGYTFEVALVAPSTNDVRAPSATGTPIDFAAAQTEEGITSRLFLDYFFNDRHQLEFYLAPMELIDYSAPSELMAPVIFGDSTFFPNPAANIQARFQFTEARLSYRYALVNYNRWRFEIGGGLQYLDSQIEITLFLGTVKEPTIVESSLVREKELAATMSSRLKYRLTPRWSGELQLDAKSGSDWYANVALLARFELAPAWDIDFGFRSFGGELKTVDLANKLRATNFVFQIGHSFF